MDIVCATCNVITACELTDIVINIFLTTAAEDDFSPLTDLTITFTSNSVVNSSSCVQYTIIGDDVKEGAESFRVSVTADNNVDLILGDTTVDISIQDNGDGDYNIYRHESSPPTQLPKYYCSFAHLLNYIFGQSMDKAISTPFYNRNSVVYPLYFQELFHYKVMHV